MEVLGSQISRYTTKYSNQNNMVLAQKQIFTSMEQNTESPELNPHLNGQLKMEVKIHNEKSLFSKLCWLYRTATCKTWTTSLKNIYKQTQSELKS